MYKLYFAMLSLLCSLSFYAQDYFPTNNGVAKNNTNYTAITNAKIFITPTNVIKKGTLLFKDGKIVNVGTSVRIPKSTYIIDASGKHVYSSFIDMYSSFGIEKPIRKPRQQTQQYDASRTGFYWNDHIMPENNALTKFKYNSKQAKALIKAGFGVVNTHIQNGIIRGRGALIALNNNGGNERRIISDNSGLYLSLNRSVTTNQSYPTSIMGSMALLRQVYLDANWYSKGLSKTKDLSLEALNKHKNLVQIMEAGSRANIIRTDKVGDQSGIQYTILGGGDEYERIKDVKATNAPLIIPINFPDAYDVEDSFLTSALTLHQMRAWNQKPTNPKVLADHGITFALTTHGLKSPGKFKANLAIALKYGLSKAKALEALTTIPAQLLKKSNTIGSLKKGLLANFLITSGDIFDEKTIIYENWVQGEQNIIESMNNIDIRGDHTFSLDNQKYTLTLKGELSKLKSEIKSGKDILGSKVTYKDHWLNITLKTKDTINKAFIRIVAQPDANKNLKGKAIMPNGLDMPFISNYKKKDDVVKSKDAKDKKLTNKILPVTYPNNAYGFNKLPKAETLLFKNATVWTNEKEGVLEKTDILIKNGIIANIGKNLSYSKAKTIDATGKHITAGIIDEHSHIATASVNEAGQNSTAEVTIEDVIDETDVNIYRNLAGGVTSIQILHGSANPIGGRSAIIKLKWGESANNLIYKNSPKFIKFALGENVKQSRYSNGVRFPQTRMGVEQVFVDYFSRAKAYNALKKSKKPYRKDLELEAIAEIINKKRFISCHSYIQSEINMLMKVAEQFNFNVNTFTHILEGYKVADKMKAHGVGASTFSDWWAYKYEVNDAIPYNAAIMHEQGLIVAINSDDAEMSRRLNQEAAKSVKYGNVSEEDALKFVTLNPAKLLHIDQKVGSLKVGKDADIVLWTDHPLSIYAKAEKTIIEGVTYFDLEKDKKIRAQIKKEKIQLVNMMLLAKNKGLKTQPIKKKEKKYLHCNSIDNEQHKQHQH